MTFIAHADRFDDDGTPVQYAICETSKDIRESFERSQINLPGIPVWVLRFDGESPVSPAELAANIASIMNGEKPLFLQAKDIVFYALGEHGFDLRCRDNEKGVTRRFASFIRNSAVESDLNLSDAFFKKLCDAHQIVSKTELISGKISMPGTPHA